MSHEQVAQMVHAAHLGRQIEAMVQTALCIGTGAFTVYESVRVTLKIHPCSGPVLTMMPVLDEDLWEAVGKPHEASEFEAFRLLLAACLLMRKLVEPGGFTAKACRMPGPDAQLMPEVLAWTWTPAAEAKEAS